MGIEQIMSLFDQLLGRRPDPTKNWKDYHPPMPDLDLSKMRFGPLGFGEDFDAAAFLGRPDRFQWTLDNYCELLYASSGFQIDYDAGRFAYLAFFIAPDEHLAKHKDLRFSKPRVLGFSPEGNLITQDYTREMLQERFGPAESTDAEPEETILYYSRQGVTMEFELDGKNGRLKRWNLYPK